MSNPNATNLPSNFDLGPIQNCVRKEEYQAKVRLRIRLVGDYVRSVCVRIVMRYASTNNLSPLLLLAMTNNLTCQCLYEAYLYPLILATGHTVLMLYA